MSDETKKPIVNKSIRELSPEVIDIDLAGSRAGRSAIHMATVYECESPLDADEKLAGVRDGYVYQRDGHPNADALAEKCRRLHNAEFAVMTASGMAASSLCMLSILKSGDQVLLSDRLYGRTAKLVELELSRFGIEPIHVDINNLEKVSEQLNERTRLVVAETISNPMLQVTAIRPLADLIHQHNAYLMIDNTFATPVVCQPLEHGADFVVESLTKMMNGHGDVTMGLLCGKEAHRETVESCLASFGMTTSPFGCWLAERGMATLYLRMKACCKTAMALARDLRNHPKIKQVYYPGLEPSQNACSQFNKSESGDPFFGSIFSIGLDSTEDLATSFIQRLQGIPYCPSLGDYVTTVSHPHSSSHRSYSKALLERLGIGRNTIRFSVGLEGADFLSSIVNEALDG